MDIIAFIAHLTNAKRSGGGDQFTARCPAHNDSHSSPSVGMGNDGVFLLRCNAVFGTAAVLDTLGLKRLTSSQLK